MSTSFIWFRGFRMTPAVRDALLAAEQRAGFEFKITQGGFNKGGVTASAGTHDGDALDFRTWHLTKSQVAKMIEALRWAGFAAWYRTVNAHYGVRAHGFSSYHVHAVPNGWGSPSAGAKRQAINYRNGRDGLASNGTDAGGPGHVSTWYTQTSPRKPITPESWFDMATKKELEEVVMAVLERRDWTKVLPDAHYKKTFPTVVNSSWRNNVLHIQQDLDDIRAENKRIEAKLDQLLKDK